jgi:hypothetical protein
VSETALTVYKGSQEIAEASTFEVMGAAFELAQKLAATEFVPLPLRNKPAAVAACILQGHEVGLPPMASLQHIHVIQGRPALDAAAQRALVLAHGHEIWIEEQTATRATVCGRRKGEDRVLSVTWTLDDAKRAKLDGKESWRLYPRNMLVARATGDVCRGAFMDVLAGIPYNVEELQDGAVLQLVGEPSPAAEETPAATVGTRRRATRPATAPAEPTTPPEAPEPEPGGGEPVAATGSEPPPVGDPEPMPEDPTPAPAAAAAPPASPAGAPTEAPAPSASAAPPAAPSGAGEKAEGENLTMAQRVAMACREAGIERADLIEALTGKRSGRDITREQAAEVLDTARAIARDEKRLGQIEGVWQVVDVVVRDEPPGDLGDWGED